MIEFNAYYLMGDEVALRQGFTQVLIRSESKSSLNLITPDGIQRGANVGGEFVALIAHRGLSDLGGITTAWQEADFLKTFTHQQIIELRFVGQHKLKRGLPDDQRLYPGSGKRPEAGHGVAARWRICGRFRQLAAV